MKTQYYTASSLDGFIATEDHSLEWLFQLGDIAATGYPDFIKEVGALAMGSSTYEWMLRHVVKPDSGASWPYAQPTWIFSSRSLPVAACKRYDAGLQTRTWLGSQSGSWPLLVMSGET